MDWTFIICDYSRNVTKYVMSFHRTYYIPQIYMKVFIENKLLFKIF